MSALHLMLPKLYACASDAGATQACRSEAEMAVSGSVVSSSRLSGSAASLALVFRAGARKQPHGLRLVRAQADERPGRSAGTSTVASGPILLRKQAVAVQGVGYEFYRRYTEALLRRYVKLSMEAGRVPSMLGRELFRGHVSSYKVHSFEDSSNFVLDVERCLGLLDPGQQHLVRRIALEEYTQEEAAAMLGMSLRTVIRRYREAIDRVTRTLLDRGMMQPLDTVAAQEEEAVVENAVKRGELVEIR